MTEAALRRAIRSAVRQAWEMGNRMSPGYQQLEHAMAYSELIILPVAEAMAEQAREEGYQAGRGDRPADAAASAPVPLAAP